MVNVGAPDFDEKVRAALTVRRPAPGDSLAQLIESALWDAAGDQGTASVLAAERIRAEGWLHRDDVDPEEFGMVPAAGIERAARLALRDSDDPTTQLRYELVFRGARSLDDPENARYYASTVTAIRSVLADLGDGDDGGSNADIVEAIRNAGRDGNPAEVGDAA
ncbi:hypothetical protein [Microbacterium arborescens]